MSDACKFGGPIDVIYTKCFYSVSTNTEKYTAAENEESCANLWSVYVSEAKRYDKALVESWKEDISGL
jgi:hypothetical protein